MKLSSLDKSLKLLDALAGAPGGMGVSELAAATGNSPSSTHHMLSTFALHDFVIKDPQTRKYSLGYRFLTLSRSILDNMDVRRIARPHLQRLFNAVGETAHLAVLRQGRVLYIDKIEKRGGLSLATYIGFTTAPHSAAGGKVLISEMTPDEIREIYPAEPLTSSGINTLSTLEELFVDLATTRRQGYALDDEEYYEGVRCVAAPIRAGGRIIASISLTGSIFTMTLERIETELKGLLMEAARNISAEMNW